MIAVGLLAFSNFDLKPFELNCPGAGTWCITLMFHVAGQGQTEQKLLVLFRLINVGRVA